MSDSKLNGNSMTQEKEVLTLVASGHAVIALVGVEEGVMDAAMVAVANNLKAYPAGFDKGWQVVVWSITEGMRTLGTTDAPMKMDNPIAALNAVREGGGRTIYVLHDFHCYIGPSNEGPYPRVRRTLRDLARDLKALGGADTRRVVLTMPSLPKLAGDIESSVTVLRWDLPGEAAIETKLDQVAAKLPEAFRVGLDDVSVRGRIISAAKGLTLGEVENCFALSGLRKRRLDPVEISRAKKAVVERSGVVKWMEPMKGGLDAVGGLEVMKGWLLQRKASFTKEARDFGLPLPKGILIVGPPGTGKTLITLCIATVYGIPVLRLDMNNLKGSLLGQSEENLQAALNVIRAVGRCVVLMDEIEKMLAGSQGSGESDGGVGAGMFGNLLGFMQENEGGAFFAATCNQIENLPSELMRRGRFDEIFFADLPHKGERAAIWEVQADKWIRESIRGGAYNYTALAAQSNGFVGAEIESCMHDAMYAAFEDGARPVTQTDLLMAAAGVTPLSVTMAEKIADVRKFLKGRAKAASADEVVDDGGTAEARFSGMGDFSLADDVGDSSPSTN